jgi:hypothetical protein
VADLEGARISSPGSRPCCLLAAPLPVLKTPIPPYFDPFDKQALKHRYGGGDVYGLVYTCRGGFLDLGHLRDLIDITRYYYDALANPGRTFPPANEKGSCVVKAPLPDDPAQNKTERIAIARSMAFAESIYHEIESYWQDVFGAHNSAFSPEDLPSNWLGTYVAEQALRDNSHDFDEAATIALDALLKKLLALDVAGTTLAFAQVRNIGRWIAGGPGRNDYLKRRNFTNTPWLVKSIPCSDTSWPSDIPLADPKRTAYEITFEVDPKKEKSSDERAKYLGEKVKSSDFELHVQRISEDAKSRYGPNFSKPE